VMWLRVGDGSAHAKTTRTIEMQMLSKVCSTLSVLENDHCSVESRYSISTCGPFLKDVKSESEEDGKYCPQCALEWVSCHRLADKPTARLDFPVFLTSELYCPNGVVTSVPGGGLNSNVDEGIAVRV
jgi:hypothetical protein